MEMNVRDDQKLVEIWLTNAEKIDPVLREGLKEIYAKYKTKKIHGRRVRVRQGRPLREHAGSAALQPPPQRRKGRAAGEKAARRGHGAMNLGRKREISSALFFFALAKLENIMYNII